MSNFLTCLPKLTPGEMHRVNIKVGINGARNKSKTLKGRRASKTRRRDPQQPSTRLRIFLNKSKFKVGQCFTRKHFMRRGRQVADLNFSKESFVRGTGTADGNSKTDARENRYIPLKSGQSGDGSPLPLWKSACSVLLTTGHPRPSTTGKSVWWDENEKCLANNDDGLISAKMLMRHGRRRLSVDYLISRCFVNRYNQHVLAVPNKSNQYAAGVQQYKRGGIRRFEGEGDELTNAKINKTLGSRSISNHSVFRSQSKAASVEWSFADQFPDFQPDSMPIWIVWLALWVLVVFSILCILVRNELTWYELILVMMSRDDTTTFRTSRPTTK